MKICKITINSFGKLKNYQIDLQDGFNSFILDNGEGKTTLFNFICAIFYGVGKNSLKDLRGLYTPWNEKSSSGSIEFIKNGKHYRIDRVFAKSSKNDESHLYDLNLGKEIYIDKSYGEYFFNLDEETFKQTLFVKQSSLVISPSLSLNNLLINTINTGNSAISLENAKNRLSEFNKVVDENNRFSLANDLLKQSKIVNDTLYEKLQEAKEINTLISENEELTNKKEALINEKEFVSKVISYKKDKENFALYETYLSLKKEEIVDDTNYDDIYKELEEINNLKEKNSNSLFIILGLMIIVISISLALAINHNAIFISILGILCFLYHFFVIRKVSKENENIRKQKESTYKKYGAVSYQQALDNINKQKYQNQNVNSKAYTSFLEKYDINTLAKYKDFKIIQEFEVSYDPYVKIEEINDKINQYSEKIAVNNGVLSKIDNSQEIASLISRKDFLNETLSKYKELTKSLNIAKEIIEISKEEVYSNFAPQLKNHLTDVLFKISDGRFKDLLIDTDLNVSLDEGNNLRKLDYYSCGYKDLVYIALRIAIIKMALKDDNLPIFLDDPFVNLDNKNYLLVMNYLKELSETHQIFYFSCNNRLN